jgi:hypothetical protein
MNHPHLIPLDSSRPYCITTLAYPNSQSMDVDLNKCKCITLKICDERSLEDLAFLR